MKRILFTLALAAMAVLPATVGAANPVVVIKTSEGTIKVELFEDKAPGTVKNFLKYVDDKHYDGTVFHRVIEDFMIQGGGFQKGFTKAADLEGAQKLEKKTGKGIKNESDNGVENNKYTIAMARTGEPDSATAQFFINTKDNDFLNRAKARDRVGYCVFGKVTAGSDVVDKIKQVRTKTLIPRIFENVPEADVVIESITRENAK